ncbi:MAG: hypothetical protein AB7R89_07880 [Dehalococcoidia bacterium]
MVRRIALAAALLAGVFVAGTAAAQQFPPNRFFGTVTVNGQAASSGTTVTAMIGETECGTTTVTSGGAYVIDVPGVTINPNCGRSGQSTVSFEVGGQAAAQTATYRDGGYQQLNLTVGGGGTQPTATATPAPTATPRPTTTPAPTAAPTSTPAPTAAPTATPRPPTATVSPQRPSGTPAAQRPAAPAAPSAQRPAAAPAAAAPAAQRPAAAPAALPRTGTGLQGDTSLTTGWLFAGGALALFGIAGAGLVLRTSRRSRS